MSRDRETEGRAKRPGTPEEDFASRWSRMKRGARAAPATEIREGAPPPADERSDEEILRELGLPDPEALKPGDDIKGFMASAVPARIRNRVLRRLWISNPMLANLDGLVDYGEDFTDAAMVPAVLETAYKVGRGWARDALEDEPGEAVAGEEQEASETGPDAAEIDAMQAAGPEAGANASEREVHVDAPPGDATESVEAQFGGEARGPSARNAFEGGNASRPAPRRMRFRFADD